MRSSTGGQGNHNVDTQIMKLGVVYVYSFIILLKSFSICFGAFMSLWNVCHRIYDYCPACHQNKFSALIFIFSLVFMGYGICTFVS